MIFTKTIVASVWVLVTATVPATGVAAPSEHFTYGRFGEVTVYRAAAEPRDVVLFVSGDGGWNLGVVAMAERLAAAGALVAGIDIRHYLAQVEKSSEKCVSPAVDFENLSHYLQAKLQIKYYLQPTLIGYSSGATLVYATLAEAPEGLFKGALSIGFCPDLDLLKPVCKGSGIEALPRLEKGRLKGVNFLPAKQLSGKWISLQGQIDQVCPAPLTTKFIEKIPGAEIVDLPRVGHGYSVEKNWVPQYMAAFARITAARSEEATPAAVLPAPVADLPLTIVPAEGTAVPWLAVFLSGDGGWAGLDRGVSAALAKHGVAVVGWDSLKYFWSPRTPGGAAADLDRVLRHYTREWNKPHVLLIGYSQGADTLPFMVNRLPANSHELVGLTALLGISDTATFEFHLANWLGNASDGIPTAPELAHWKGSRYLCIYGEEDLDSACAQQTGGLGIPVKMAGGHHFGGNYEEIAREILKHLPGL